MPLRAAPGATRDPNLEAATRPPAAPRRATVTAGALGAATWLLLVGVRLAGVPVDWWRWRDDAVITLSHARNLVEFGTIGVSPGGDRVEGFSSPLQFLLSAGFFAIPGTGYGLFLDLQVVVCVALTGALAALVLLRVARSSGLGGRRAWWVAVLAGAGVALVTVSSWTATGWFVSGMENPLAAVLGLAIVLVVVGPPLTVPRAAGLGVLVGLLGLVRVELPALMLPLVAGVVAVAWRTAPVAARARAVAAVVGVPAAIWAVVHLGRRLYFGAWLPNTALAQDKSAGARQVVTLVALMAVFALLVALVVLTRSRPRLGGLLWLALSVACLAAYARLATRPPLPPWSDDAFQGYAVLLAIGAALGATQFALSRRTPGPWLPDLVLAGLVFVPVAQVVVFGPARMEPFRVGSIAVPWAALWLAVAATRLLAARATVPSRDRGARSWWQPVALVLVAASVLAGVGAAVHDEARDMPWRVSPSEDRILAVSDAFRAEQLGGVALPIVANPDLGKLSFAKRAVIVDLGRLGDPVLARISAERPDLEAAYLGRVAAPDVVEAHEYWSCRYRDWIGSADFAAHYVLSDPRWATAGPAYDPACPVQGRYAIWVRADADRELGLTRDIAASPYPAAVVRAAARECASDGTDPFRCEWVRRAVTRTSQLLRDQGLLAAAADALSGVPTAALDRELLLRGPGWGERAYREFLALAGG